MFILVLFLACDAYFIVAQWLLKELCFHFLIRPSKNEGSVLGSVNDVSTSDFASWSANSLLSMLLRPGTRARVTFWKQGD